MPMSSCQAAKGAPKNKCCRDSSCSGTGCGATGTIYKWEFCKATECCATQIEECNRYECYTDYRFVYKYEKCSTADSCRNTKYLQPGLCLDSGCAKGGGTLVEINNKHYPEIDLRDTSKDDWALYDDLTYFFAIGYHQLAEEITGPGEIEKGQLFALSGSLAVSESLGGYNLILTFRDITAS